MVSFSITHKTDLVIRREIKKTRASLGLEIVFPIKWKSRNSNGSLELMNASNNRKLYEIILRFLTLCFPERFKLDEYFSSLVI